MIRCDKNTRLDFPSSQVRGKAAMRSAASNRARVLGGGFPAVRSMTPYARVGDIAGVLAGRGRVFAQYFPVVSIARRQLNSKKFFQNQSSLPTPGHRSPSKQSLAPGAAGC
jgi:hypothetical protein